MQAVFSEELSFPFFFFWGWEVGGGLGKQGRDNKQGGRIRELTIFAKTYLFLVYFLILLGLKLYGYLNTISNQNAYYFTVRLL